MIMQSSSKLTNITSYQQAVVINTYFLLQNKAPIEKLKNGTNEAMKLG